MSLRLTTRALPVSSVRLAPRAFSTTALRSAAGDTGAPRSGGAASADAFTKREQADEGLYIRKQEAEKLAALKKKVSDAEADLAKDRAEVEKLIAKKNGEQK